MQIGMIGLGRMGANMARRLMKDRHTCVVYDHAPEKVESLSLLGAVPSSSLEDLVSKLASPKAVWLMLPAGEPTEATVTQLYSLLPRGSIVIDGGNSFYKDDVRRYHMLQAKGIHYVDSGTSGGIWGFERGYCLMLGGDSSVVRRLEPIFSALAPGPGDIPATSSRKPGSSTADQGFLYCGPSGAGHFVKMVHNGIEYGLMQSYAEGFHVLHTANSPHLPDDFRYELDLAEIAELWRRGSVVSSWLLDLTAEALAESPMLANFAGFVPDSGEGCWTIQTAIDLAVPVEVLSAALYTRFRSRQPHTFAEKVLSAMRQKFGGHIEPVAQASLVA
jgi:6-phosphogluconate dehydrogenase